MSNLAFTAIPPLAHAGLFPSPIVSAPVPLYAPVNPYPSTRPALRRTETGSTAASDLGGDLLSRSTTRSSAMSALRRVRSLPGLGLQRRASGASSTTNSSSADEPEGASGLSRVRSRVSVTVMGARGRGAARLFGRLVRRGRRDSARKSGDVEDAGPGADVDVVAGPTRRVQRVSFADQPELAQLRRVTAHETRPPTPRPAPAPMAGDDESDDEQYSTTGENVSLLRERRQSEEYMYARNEWWRSGDYYALVFPWC